MWRDFLIFIAYICMLFRFPVTELLFRQHHFKIKFGEQDIKLVKQKIKLGKWKIKPGKQEVKLEK